MKTERKPKIVYLVGEESPDGGRLLAAFTKQPRCAEYVEDLSKMLREDPTAPIKITVETLSLDAPRRSLPGSRVAIVDSRGRTKYRDISSDPPSTPAREWTGEGEAASGHAPVQGPLYQGFGRTFEEARRSANAFRLTQVQARAQVPSDAPATATA